MILTGDQLPPVGIDYVLLTPELAAEWLTLNTGNRREKFVKQASMVRDLTAGRWIMTGETFKFDLDYRLIDGQNRCRAVIASGVSIPALVVSLLAPEAQGSMDAGTPRSSRDALYFAGVKSEKDVNAVANVHLAWTTRTIKHATSTIPGGSRMTNSETVEYVKKLHEIEAVAIAAKSIYSRGLRLPVGSIGTALIELGKIDAEACDDFFQRILDVQTSGKGDPIATLIKRVADMRTNRQRIAESTALFFLFRAWNADRTGEQLTKFQIGSADSGWTPIPEPK